MNDEDNAWYDHQLVGLDVVRDDTVIGKVVRVDHLPAQDLLIVKANDDEIMVPFVEAIVPAVDVAAGRVIVTPPPGLFEEVPEHRRGGPRRRRRVTDRYDRRMHTSTPSGRAAHRIDVVSIFPSYFDGLALSLLGKARDSGILDVQVHDLRDWTSGPAPHRR